MVGFYSYFSAKTSSANSMQKIDEAKDAYQKTESVLSDISHMSKELEEGIKDFDRGLEELTTVSESTRDVYKRQGLNLPKMGSYQKSIR